MAKNSNFLKLFKEIQVLRFPRHRISTFGVSEINYVLVTDVPGLPDRARLREGTVRAEKPQIITPHNVQERFSGFGPRSEKYGEWLMNQYGQALRGLEYQFKNNHTATRIELRKPEEMVKILTKEFDDRGGYRQALIKGIEKIWPMSLMKFIIEESISSFQTNVQELNERGFFDGEKRIEDRKRREIQHLFQKAKGDAQALSDLSKKLKEYGLFEQYQDEFFQLVK